MFCCRSITVPWSVGHSTSRLKAESPATLISHNFNRFRVYSLSLGRDLATIESVNAPVS